MEIEAGRGILEDIRSAPGRARRMSVPTILQKSQLELKHFENLGIVSPHDYTSNRLASHELTSIAMTADTPVRDLNHSAAPFLVLSIE
jgi:hypothetical protein